MLPSFRAGMVELVDTLDLGSSALWACRFDPCSRYLFLINGLHANAAHFFLFEYA